ncbi:MAG: hypothetical protein ACRDRG_05640 [Pseudonocardiaceae bacterium]
MVRNRTSVTIAAAVLAVVGMAGTAAADERPAGPTSAARAIQPSQAPPPGANCRVIDFESAQVYTLRTVPARHVLVVHGEKPYFNMQVNLRPLVYIQQPEHWGIEVVGCLPEVGLPAVADYAVKLDLDGTIGTRGIEVIGANHSEKIDIVRKREGRVERSAASLNPRPVEPR